MTNNCDDLSEKRRARRQFCSTDNFSQRTCTRSPEPPSQAEGSLHARLHAVARHPHRSARQARKLGYRAADVLHDAPASTAKAGDDYVLEAGELVFDRDSRAWPGAA